MFRRRRQFYWTGHRNWRQRTWRITGLLAILFVVTLLLYQRDETSDFIGRTLGPRRESPATGIILAMSEPTHLSLDQTNSLIKQTNDLAHASAKYPVSKRQITYNSKDKADQSFKVTARVYWPRDLPTDELAPVFAFAPGTTGMGDQCAASREQPAVKNWANYESHLVAYAGQGYAVIMTDYEGLGDPSRIHHYMVGELEGRSVLDSVRALFNLPDSKTLIDKNRVFLAGYSQGGHAAFWADRLVESYAPELSVQGIIGFGPVSDPFKTLRDVTKGANINWFGPLVLASYGDYYGAHYSLSRILLPQWTNDLLAHASAHCIDSISSYWGRTPDKIYTPEFVAALRDNKLSTSGYATLAGHLGQNSTGNAETASDKLINQGAQDNVILPEQQTEMMSRLCRHSRGAASLKLYPTANHYNTMSQSFADTVSWMRQVSAGTAVQNNCR